MHAWTAALHMTDLASFTAAEVLQHPEDFQAAFQHPPRVMGMLYMRCRPSAGSPKPVPVWLPAL